MSLYYPIPQPTIATNVLVRRERRLPVPGEVLVRAGQRVEPSDPVAQTTLSSEPARVDIAADLDLSPGSVPRRLRVSPGQQVEQGGVLAQRGGIGSRTSRSPVTGTFSGYDSSTGIGLITMPAEPVSVQAHLKGIVTDLIPYYGAIIETPATLIRGIFGLGGEQHGVLKVLVTGHDEAMTAGMLDARVAYAVVLGGSEVTAEALQRLIELGARGLVAGSIRSSELAGFLGHDGPGAWRLGAGTTGSDGWNFPPLNPSAPARVPRDFVLVVTEGFGSVPMCSRTFELLAASDGQEVAIDGSTRLRGGLARPEIIIPLPRTTQVRWIEEKDLQFRPGVGVRLLSPGYLGQIGRVASVPPGPKAAQSGVVAQAADVELADGQRLRVPAVDLEVLE